jgi:hypothetical protein
MQLAYVLQVGNVATLSSAQDCLDASLALLDRNQYIKFAIRYLNVLLTLLHQWFGRLRHAT